MVLAKRGNGKTKRVTLRCPAYLVHWVNLEICEGWIYKSFWIVTQDTRNDATQEICRIEEIVKNQATSLHEGEIGIAGKNAPNRCDLRKGVIRRLTPSFT